MIRIVEVGPRDGLQNEKATIPTKQKVALVDALSASHVDEIEVSAFVSPRWVPQLADAEEVFRDITRRDDVVYSALVPNERGLERAFACNVDKIAVFTAASESFNQKNINASIAESIRRFVPVIEHAKQSTLMTRGYISTAFWCPYEGKIAPAQVASVAARLVDLGVDELSIGDTIGKATPDEVRALLDGLLALYPPSMMAMHFHDTYGHAIENVVTSWQLGITTFDASAGGLGGCPYAPGAPGNVATEAVVQRLREEGGETRVDLDNLRIASALAASLRSPS